MRFNIFLVVISAASAFATPIKRDTNATIVSDNMDDVLNGAVMLSHVIDEFLARCGEDNLNAALNVRSALNNFTISANKATVDTLDIEGKFNEDDVLAIIVEYFKEHTEILGVVPPFLVEKKGNSDALPDEHHIRSLDLKFQTRLTINFAGLLSFLENGKLDNAVSIVIKLWCYVVL
ncbi:hypothetical protein PM082_000284 [Marasmius tenuissimus]|nr:hypothetical protein PM082_000284 [Marasmius tenuissimus]